MAMENLATTELPAIPAKRYFTIGEVSELCGGKPHVLRSWDQGFRQPNPLKRPVGQGRQRRGRRSNKVVAPTRCETPMSASDSIPARPITTLIPAGLHYQEAQILAPVRAGIVSRTTRRLVSRKTARASKFRS